MFELFTDRARKVVTLAREEAFKFNFEYVGTEHILAGLLKENTGVAHHVLEALGISIGKIHLEIEKIVQPPGDVEVDRERLAFSPRARNVFTYAVDEAKLLGHTYIGTEHILLGLLREDSSTAGQILLNLGINLKETRAAVLELLGFTDERYEFEQVYSNGGDLYNVVKILSNGVKEHMAFYDNKNKKISVPKAVDLDDLGKIINAIRNL
jgi:ATP-dependent Clp protease ATP-binding subunit ClpA